MIPCMLVLSSPYCADYSLCKMQPVTPKLWNSVPLQVRAAQCLDHFKSLLKTHLFSAAPAFITCFYTLPYCMFIF